MSAYIEIRGSQDKLYIEDDATADQIFKLWSDGEKDVVFRVKQHAERIGNIKNMVFSQKPVNDTTPRKSEFQEWLENDWERRSLDRKASSMARFNLFWLREYGKRQKVPEELRAQVTAMQKIYYKHNAGYGLPEDMYRELIRKFYANPSTKQENTVA